MATSIRATDVLPEAGDSVGLAVDQAKASFARSLRPANKAPRTAQTYLDGLEAFGPCLASRGMPRNVGAIRREPVEPFVVEFQERGCWPASVSNRYRSLRQFFRWLVKDDDIGVSPMAKMRPQAVPVEPPEVPTPEHLRRHIKACQGSDFESLRDTAMVRLLIDTKMRRAECAGLTVSDFDFDHAVVVALGKGCRSRAVPLCRKTAAALDRYLRLRARHPRALSEALCGPDVGFTQRYERLAQPAPVPVQDGVGGQVQRGTGNGSGRATHLSAV